MNLYTRYFAAFLMLTLFSTVSLAHDNKIKVISTDEAPKSKSYSQGMKFNDFVFVSGQISRNPDGSNVTGDITEQTTRVMDNIGAILNAARLDFCDVVMATVYLATLDDFNDFNKAYTSYFSDCVDKDNDEPVLPARATVGGVEIPGSTKAQPLKVEISVIAAKQKSKKWSWSSFHQ